MNPLSRTIRSSYLRKLTPNERFVDAIRRDLTELMSIDAY
jgi:hypothetical protein